MSHELLTRVQKELCQSYQKEIAETVNDGPVVEKYCQGYEDHFKTCKFSPAAESELEKAISQARIVLFSDYHSLKTDKKQFLKYVKKEAERGEKPVIALECFYPKSQGHLDGFLQGRITEEEFLKRTDFKKWGFDWQLYKPIFDFARDNSLRVVGINYTGGNMPQRDKAVAGRIAKLEGKVFVLFGESHLLKTRIPAHMGNQENCVIVHQNPAELYWRLAENKKERERVLKLENNEYVLNIVPPVLKLQSFINSVEGNVELDYGNGANIEDQVCNVVKKIGRVLGIRVPNRWLDSLSIYTHFDANLLQNRLGKASRCVAKENLEFVKEQLSKGQSCFIPAKDSNTIFLGNLALDEAAEEAMHFIHRMCSGYTNGLSGPDAFYAYCVYEALGFMGSKIVNPNREFDEREYQKVFEKSEGSHKTFVAYHLLGYHLGERLYQMFTGEQSGIKEAVVKALKTNLNKPEKAKEVYFELVRLTAGNA